jgi:hypothetical protein
MSEKVVANGKTLKINEDYMLDYDVGILTILKDEYITNDTVIDVSYDYSPLGGSSAGSTLVGVRSQYDFTDNISLGGSFIYEFAAEDTKLPDVYTTPASTLVGEVDAKVKNIKITDSLKVSASAEYAMSKYNQNTTGKAIVESMESAKQDDSFSLIDDNWFYAATPKDDVHEKYHTNSISWKNYDIEKKDIDKNLEIISGEKQQVMDVYYNLTSYAYASIGQIVSAAGYDFSKKLYLEIWIKANFAQVNVRLDLASAIDEDSDQNGQLGTEDTNGDGVISPWEDIGRNFENPDSSISKIGANNGRLDTEDLNGNNRLDRYETIIKSFNLEEHVPDITKTSWQRIQIPLDITDTDRENWKNVRIARLTINRHVSDCVGKLTIGKISVVGNKWTKEKYGSIIDENENQIFSIGRDNPQYVSLLTNSYYRDLYDIDSDSKRDEQALAIKYDLDSTSDELYARATYSSGFDLSNYEKFKFFLYITSTTAVSPEESNFIMRIGGDENNYYEYSLPMSSEMKEKWNVIEIKQKGY